MALCPKHQVQLKTWPSGDQYCPNLDPTGKEAKNGKRYCTYILKTVKADAAEISRRRAAWDASVMVKNASDAAGADIQQARIANNDTRVIAVMQFSGRVFQGHGADQAVNALEFAKMALSLFDA